MNTMNKLTRRVNFVVLNSVNPSVMKKIYQKKPILPNKKKYIKNKNVSESFNHTCMRHKQIGK